MPGSNVGFTRSGRRLWLILRPSQFNGQIENIDFFFVAQHKGMFDGILQFTHISRPSMIHEEPQGGLGETLNFFVCFLVLLGDKMTCQEGNVLFSMSEGWYVYGKNLQTVIQILPKFPGPYELK